ncbi:unnamed protein product [Lepidochelys olivacea]
MPDANLNAFSFIGTASTSNFAYRHGCGSSIYFVYGCCAVNTDSPVLHSDCLVHQHHWIHLRVHYLWDNTVCCWC